jgi:hypothetical protein
MSTKRADVVNGQLPFSAQDHSAKGSMGSQQTGEVRSTHTVFIQQVAQSFQAGHL